MIVRFQWRQRVFQLKSGRRGTLTVVLNVSTETASSRLEIIRTECPSRLLIERNGSITEYE